MATKAELEAQVADQQEWIAELESAVMVFEPFTGAVGVAETRKAGALDIGVSTAKMRTVVDVCEKISAAREEQECAEDCRYGLGCE